MRSILTDLFGPGTWGTGGNLVAAALLFLLGLLFRKPLRRLWRRLAGDRADLEDIRRAAAAAHKIAADLFEHHTGAPHPEAPPKAESEAE